MKCPVCGANIEITEFDDDMVLIRQDCLCAPSKQTIKDHITENNLLSGDSEENHGDNKSMWGTYEMCQELKRAKRREEYL